MSEDAYSEEDALSLENAFEIELQNLADLESRQHRVISQQAVDRLTMESLHQKYPEAVDENFPVSSFSKDPSDQNLPVSMESFTIAKAVATAAAGALLGSIIFMLIKLFRTDNAEQRALDLDKKIGEMKDDDKSITELKREAMGLKLSTDDTHLVSAIVANNHLEFLDPPIKAHASSQGKIFMEAVSPGGDVFQLLSKWSRSIHNHYSSFSARVNGLTEAIGKMYEVDPKDADKFVKNLEANILEPDDAFFKDMGELHDTFQSFLQRSQGEYKGFLNDNVFNTQEFYDMALSDDQWPRQVDKISPNGGKGLDKNLDRLEKDAQALVDGKREAAYKAKRAKNGVRIDAQGNMEMDAVVGNVTVERAVKNAELAIRSEVQFLRMYRTNLNRVLEFYRQLSLKALECNTERKRILREIINRSQN